MIYTQAPKKGDFVTGHKAVAFFPKGLPCIRGQIAATTKSGATVTFEIDRGLATILGLRRKTKWSWRAKTGSYQQKGSRASQDVGLALVLRNKPKKSKNGWQL